MGPPPLPPQCHRHTEIQHGPKERRTFRTWDTEDENPHWTKSKDQKSKLLCNFKILLNVSCILYSQTAEHICADSHSICLYFHKCTTVIYATKQPRWLRSKGNKNKRVGTGRRETQRPKVKSKHMGKGSAEKGYGWKMAGLWKTLAWLQFRDPPLLTWN